ncbi:MAG: hypothetical protein HC902_04510 [Calothrix sp. SM1_5_4]|nr:hypothetical protein [Calothrix sp. SM1_5_4]
MSCRPVNPSAPRLSRDVVRIFGDDDWSNCQPVVAKTPEPAPIPAPDHLDNIRRQLGWPPVDKP